ncbi:MAG: sensor histidine kinase [Anaerolineales bacterium]|jgi:signal transduction histidine kinase
MHFHYIIVIYFFYGLAFFSMGLLVILEGNRASDLRLRKALRPLAGFGIVHGVHEWVDMFEQMERLMGHDQPIIPEYVSLALLAISFVSLIAFGTYLLAYTETAQRIITLVPIGLEAIWVFGLASFRGRYPTEEIWGVADVWTRYVLAMPGGLLAAIGLVAQQRAFRRSGLIRFGQDALWAAVAFAWYGVVGQFFGQATALPPSNVINQDLFMEVFGFPVQLFRAAMAVAAAYFVIRFLRAFQVETEQKISELQTARLEEAQKRESLKGELFRRIVDAQEAERQRIARDLHDETGQALTAIGMGLRGLSTALTNNRDRDQTVKTLRNLENLSADSLRELQRIIADLRPSHLDDLGLPAALRWYAGKVQERTDLKVMVEIEGDELMIASTLKIAIFRIIQEALNNITKHAQAKVVFIHLKYKPNRVIVSVRDDGVGFDLDQVRMRRTRRPSLGLAGMRERAALLGGEVNIQSSPGQGTLVEAILPLQSTESEV